MMAFLKRTIAPRGLGLAFALAIVPFLCRVDNAFMWMLDAQGLVLPFMSSLCLGTLLACLAAALVVPRSDRREGTWTVVACACSVAGLVACGFVEGPAPLACAIGGGALFGFGMALTLRQWWIIYRPLRLDTKLVTTGLALLLASIAWYFMCQESSFYVVCFSLIVCAACAGLLCLLFQVTDTRRERLADEDAEEKAAVAAEAAAAAGAPAAEPAQPSLLWIAIAAAGGLCFNFFALGLTFYPEAAGFPNQVAVCKPIPYLIVALAILIGTYLLSGKRIGYATFLAAVLAIAAAIELASPFIEQIVEPGALPMSFTYTGVALFNALGFALPLHRLREDERRYSRGAALIMAGCALSMGLGCGLFQLLGETTQVIATCILTVYLAALVVAAAQSGVAAATRAEEVIDAAGQPEQQPAAGQAAEAAEAPATAPAPAEAPDRRRVACDHLIEQYQLSPRESEVLWLLARGYGARYIADRLYISADTVRTHCKRIYEKVGVHTKEELIELIESFEDAPEDEAPAPAPASEA